jgi:hypothetical protein
MDALWRVKLAIASAAKGWLCIWLLLLIPLTINIIRTIHRVPSSDELSMVFLWIFATGIVTLGTTLLLIVPYVCLRNTSTLLDSPWHIYAESSALVILASIAITHLLFIIPAQNSWMGLIPFLTFALPTSLTSCAFYMRGLKAMSGPRLIADSN